MKILEIINPKTLSVGLKYGRRVAYVLSRDPVGGLDRLLLRVMGRETGRARYNYEVASDWEQNLHKILGQPWPCPAIIDFYKLWPDVINSLTAKGLKVGRGSYDYWDDGNLALARVAWCLTHHLRPLRVVETGVARGITTRFILEALERNGDGLLWSIDLPSPDSSLHNQIGAAVAEQCRRRWTYLEGTSRHHLPRLLATLGEIEIFIHDSLHTERNLRFEMDRAWRSLKPGGVLIADDIDLNPGFGSFTRSVPRSQWLVGQHDDRRGLFGVILKESEGSSS